MNEILKKLSKELLSGKEVAELLDNPKDFPIKLVENLSIETALNYWNE
jgi:flagellar biosynthesis component FlhA